MCMDEGTGQERGLLCAVCVKRKSGDDDQSMQVVEQAATLATIPPQRKKGGRKKGSTKANKRKQLLAELEATNWVVEEYAAAKSKVDIPKNLPRGTRPPRVEVGLRKRLVAQAKKDFGIEGDFDVSKQVIDARIKTGKLEVWHRGTPSPVLALEVMLNAFVIIAWHLNSPLSKPDLICLANHLIKSTGLASTVVEFKKKHTFFHPDQPLLGDGWYGGYFGRNKDLLESKKGQKYACNRADGSSYVSLEKMYDDRYDSIIRSGNGKKLDVPVLMDMRGNIVTDESLAFGLPVDVELTHPENVFFVDETGENTIQKNDGPYAGQKVLVPIGNTPTMVAKDNHFTVVPVSNACGNLKFVCVIFCSKKLRSLDSMGFDTFASEHPGGTMENVGPGKRYPGGPVCIRNGTEVSSLNKKFLFASR